MKLLLLAVTHRTPGWAQQACEEYAKRLPATWSLKVEDIKAAPRQTGKTPQQNMALEAQRLQAALQGKPGPKFALDERGQTLTSQGFCDLLVKHAESSGHLTLIIGGPDGLDAEFKQSCDGLIRLSAMTLPHALARVVALEQIYRAWSIANQHPYHRE